MRSLLTALLLVICSSAAREAQSAEPLSPARELRKLSLHLRGVLPTAQEYEALSQASGDVRAFIAARKAEYLASPQHVSKMSERLDALFKVSLPSQPMEDFPDVELKGTSYLSGQDAQNDQLRVRNSMNALFRRMARENLSWDQLLLSKRYTQYPDPNYSGLNDTNFYGELTGTPYQGIPSGPYSYPSAGGPGKELSFEAGDPRIAGALTTHRFVDRYKNSGINRNRRRAAAVFRIFLCDEMRPLVTPSPEDTQALLDKVFPSKEAMAMAVHSAKAAQGKHGSDPACMACHFKLDPMGRAFESIGSALLADPSPGQLVYLDESGQKVALPPAAGIGEIAEQLTRQRRYASCQVGHFWRWFIGKDVPLTSTRRDQLVAKFDELGRRTNDFVSWLVDQPEFRVPPAKDNPAAVYFQARDTLTSCNQCHVSSAGKPNLPPDFTRFPIGGDAASHSKWVSRIARSMNLKGAGEMADMPPNGADWTQGQRKLAVDQIRSWICAGSPDENGAPTVDAAKLPAGVCGGGK
jgi:hypothetical protein